jgi:hypothetical protein
VKAAKIKALTEKCSKEGIFVRNSSEKMHFRRGITLRRTTLTYAIGRNSWF